MRCLGFYLWKEWREFRSIAIGILVAVPLLLGICGAVLPARIFEVEDHSRAIAMTGALGALLMTLFALTTDLFAGEVRRGRVSFLERMPQGLRTAFVAKSIIYFAATSAAFVYGFMVASWITELCGGRGLALGEFIFHERWAGLAGHGVFIRIEALLIGLIVLAALPAACMSPRGVLTLPLTALLLGACAVAVVAVHGPAAGLLKATLMNPWTRGGIAACLLIGAYLAFVRGRRWSGGELRVFRLGLVGFMLAVLPPLVPAAKAALAMRGYLGGETHIASAHIGADFRAIYVGRYIRYDGRLMGAMGARRIDLETGEVTSVDALVIGTLERQPGAHSHLMTEAGALDTRTGEVGPPTEHDLRHLSPLRDPEGRRVWVSGNSIMLEGAGEVCKVEGYWSPRLVDHGIRATRKLVFDCTRMRMCELRDRRLLNATIRVRRGQWLVRISRKKGWELYDPDSESFAAPKGLEEKDSVSAIHDDGRLFVMRAGGEFDLLDPETGEFEPIRFEDGSRATGSAFDDAGGLEFRNSIARAPDGSRVFYVDNVPTVFVNSSLQLVRAKLRAVERVLFLGCAPDGRLWVRIGNDRILQLRFGSDEQKAIYRER